MKTAFIRSIGLSLSAMIMALHVGVHCSKRPITDRAGGAGLLTNAQNESLL